MQHERIDFFGTYRFIIVLDDIFFIHFVVVVPIAFVFFLLYFAFTHGFKTLITVGLFAM